MKYKCINEVYSDNLRNYIREGEIIEVKEFYPNGFNSKCYNLFTNDGRYIGFLKGKKLDRYFEECIEKEEQEECTVTTEPTREVFKGWDILRLITEGKLKEGTKLYDNNTTCSCTYKDGCLIDECEEEVDMDYIIHGEFEIYEPKIRLVSYKEAVENNSMIRHRNWDDSLKHTTVHNVLSFYTKEKNDGILNDLLSDEKCWEVE